MGKPLKARLVSDKEEGRECKGERKDKDTVGLEGEGDEEE